MSLQPEEFDHLYTSAAEKVAARRVAGQHSLSVLSAVVFLPPGRTGAAWRDILTTYCIEHRYAIVAVATSLASALTLIAAGDARVLVIGKPDHLPTTSGPRIEFVTSPAPAESEDQRRPQRRTWGDQ